MILRQSFDELKWITLLILVAGCAPAMNKKEITDMQSRRPAQLDQLNGFIGRWEGTTETWIRGAKEAVKGTLQGHWTWDCDGWCVLDRNESDMGDMGKGQGLSLWTWDAAGARYRFYWSNSRGGTGHGTAYYDETTRTWHTRGRSESPAGVRSTKGSIRMVNDRTAQWVWQEFGGPFGLTKMLEQTGTSKRINAPP